MSMSGCRTPQPGQNEPPAKVPAQRGQIFIIERQDVTTSTRGQWTTSQPEPPPFTAAPSSVATVGIPILGAAPGWAGPQDRASGSFLRWRRQPSTCSRRCPALDLARYEEKCTSL